MVYNNVENALENRERRAQIYTLPVVVGMMLLQRLNERGTQQEAVHQIAAGRLDGLLPDGKRVRAGKISPSTGGYARACGRMSIGVVEKVCDQLLAELGQRIEPQPGLRHFAAMRRQDAFQKKMSGEFQSGARRNYVGRRRSP